MRKTSNIELSLYDPTDTFDITGSSNSLNHNMEIIDQKFSDTTNSSDIEKVNKDIASLKTETGSLKEDLGNYDSKLRSFKDVNATEIVSGKLLNLKYKTDYPWFYS